MSIPENIQYIIKTTPRIDEKKLRSLITKYRKNKDLKLKEQIVNSYLWLVLKIAQKFYNKYLGIIDLFDLFEEGMAGLVKAVDSYKPLKNCSFYLYAEKLIKQFIMQYIKEKPISIINIPKRVFLKVKKFKDVWNKFVEETGVQPSFNDISKRMGITYQQAQQIYQYVKMLETYESLSNPIGEDITIEDSLEDKDYSLEDVLSIISTKEVLEETLKKVLTSKEFTIIKQRYLKSNKTGTAKKTSYRALARILHTSHEYVRKAEKRILKKLLDYIKEKF